MEDKLAYRLIPLTRGVHAAVSSQDYEKVMRYRWYVHAMEDGRCVVRRDGERRERRGTALASYILDVLPPTIVDHWNGNPLDNRRINLRAGTQAQNMYNKPKVWRNGQRPFSQYKGVFRVSRANRNTKRPFMARITIGRKYTHLGCFETEEAAAMAYDSAAREIELIRGFFRPNFPRPEELPPDPPLEITQQVVGNTDGSYAQLRFSQNAYVGVCPSRDKWRWRISQHKREICRGGFSTAIEAAVSRDMYIIENDMPHSRNFSNEELESLGKE